MKPIQIYLDEEIIKKLKLTAIEQGTNMSELVRRILDDDNDTGFSLALEKKPAQHKDFIKANEAIVSAKVPEEGRYVQTPEGIVGPSKLKPKSMGFCKEGHPIPNGRTKCLGKGCKYS